MNICVIPARGGSKRIPRKNIKEFNGKPIIAYSIEAAKKSNCFEQIIVSTDDAEIAEVAKAYGALVPFVRPAELSNDYVGAIPVIRHALESVDTIIPIKFVCCLFATAPFIQPEIINNALRQLKSSGAYFCFSVTSFPSPIQRSFTITERKRISMLYPESFNDRSQDLEEAYHDAGQFYWGYARSFKEEPLLFSEISSPYILPRYLVQDIDSQEDWIKAELMYQVLKNNNFIS